MTQSTRIYKHSAAGTDWAALLLGAGLGLTLAQTYVQQNYGFIGCTSKPGTTDFQMQLPFRLKTEEKQ